MAAMQAEKLVRTVVGSSCYPNEQQRAAVLAKVEKLLAEEVYKRLSAPVAKLVSAETAAEMARFYQTSYGQKLVKQMYNSGLSFGEPAAPQATAAEKVELKKPSYIKASKEMDVQRSATRHEVFVLVTRP